MQHCSFVVDENYFFCLWSKCGGVEGERLKSGLSLLMVVARVVSSIYFRRLLVSIMTSFISIRKHYCPILVT